MLKAIKNGTLVLTAVLLTTTAFAKPISNKGQVLWFRNGTDILRVQDSSNHKNVGRIPSTSIVVSNSPSLVSMQNTHQLTLAAWIKPNSIPYEFPVIISKGGFNTPGANGGYELILNAHSDNDVGFFTGVFYADTHGANGSLINHHLGEWIHVAVTVDTTNQVIQIYVNGQAYSNIFTYGSLSDVNFDVTNDLYVGTPDPLANPNRVPFDGPIKQVLIYNRALSADEILNIFNVTKPK